MFQNPDGIAVHGISRAKAIDGIFSNTYPLSSVVKYAHKTDIIYYKIIIDLTKIDIDLTDTLTIWLLTKYLLSREGRWKVVAKFNQGKENIFSREFEVKKYGKSFMLPSDSASALRSFLCWSFNSISTFS